MKLSFVNLAATATITSSGDDTSYPASNLGTPELRWTPAKLLVITDSWWLFDFGSTKTIEQLHLLRANFTSCRIQGNATDVWTSPSYNVLITIAQNLFNEQYQHAMLPVAFAYRYMRIFVPAQTPVEAPLTVFRLGGVYAGATLTAPTKFSVDFDHETVDPFEDIQPQSGEAWRDRVDLGNVLVRLRIRRRALFTYATPYVSDDVRTWALSVDAAARNAGFFALYEDLGNPTMGWIVMALNRSYAWAVQPNAPSQAEMTWELEERTR